MLTDSALFSDTVFFWVSLIGGLCMIFSFCSNFMFKGDVKGFERSGMRGPFVRRDNQKVRLQQRTVLSHDSLLLRFELPSNNQVLGLPIGRHVLISLPNRSGVEAGKWNKKDDLEVNSSTVSRKYTPVTLDSNARGFFELVVKVYRPNETFPDGGRLSLQLDKLKVGQCVDVSGPYGLIEYRGRGIFVQGNVVLPHKKKICMMAGGSGITPMLQIIQAIIRDPEDSSEIFLIYANQSENDILCHDTLKSLVASCPRLHVHYTVDRIEDKSSKNLSSYSVGYITKEMISEHLPEHDSSCIVLLCGPPPMVKLACHQNLDELNWPKEDRLTF